MTQQGHVEGAGDGRILSSYYRGRIEYTLEEIEERKEALLARLEEADDPEERRSIGEELANLPPVIRVMGGGTGSVEPEGD